MNRENVSYTHGLLLGHREQNHIICREKDGAVCIAKLNKAVHKDHSGILFVF